MSKRIELSKLISIEIDDQMNVINWNSDDDINVYSEERHFCFGWERI